MGEEINLTPESPLPIARTRAIQEGEGTSLPFLLLVSHRYVQLGEGGWGDEVVFEVCSAGVVAGQVGA